MEKLIYKLVMVQVALCDLGTNIRTMFDDNEIRSMAESLKKRQLHPIIVKGADTLGKFLVIDGGKRVRAALLAGIVELLAIVTHEDLTEQQIRDLQLVAAFHRSDPSHFDKWKAMEAVKSGHDWSNKQIADYLDIDPKMVKVLLSPGQCIEAVQSALRDGKIGISVCHELSLLDAAQQLRLLEKKLAGSSRDQIARESRKQRNGSTSAARMSRIRIALPSGVQITMAGNELTLEDAIGELNKALAEMRKAEKQGLDVKTFQAVCRDRAKAAT